MGPDGMDSSDLTKIAGPAVKGMFYTSVAGPVTVYKDAAAFAKEYKDKFKKDPEPFAAQAYDSAAIGLKGIEAAAKAAGGKVPSREQVSVAVRKTKHTGLTGAVEFDEKGDPKKAQYFVLGWLRGPGQVGRQQGDQDADHRGSAAQEVSLRMHPRREGRYRPLLRS